MLSGVSAVAFCLGIAGTAWSQQPQDPNTGGQLNRCWGEVASQIAKLSDDSLNGGGMGAHSRSSNSPQGGFGQNEPRDGVGNVSEGFPHGVHPGDGGNGQHAINNGEGFSTVQDPVTGEFVAGDPLECESSDQPVGDVVCGFIGGCS
jgi:hypothetical protein